MITDWTESMDNNEMVSVATWSIDNEMDDTDCTPIGNSTWTGAMENDIRLELFT